MFKIVNFAKKIIGTGIKISQDLCIFPKIIMKSERFQDFCLSSTLEFFDDSKGRFKIDGLFYCLENNLIEDGFCLAEIEGNCEAHKLKIYSYRRRDPGRLIAFMKKTQMLESIVFSPIGVKENVDIFRVGINLESFTPSSGGVAINLQGEFLGLFIVGTGYYCISYFYIMKELSRLFDEEANNHDLRAKLLAVNGLKIKLSNYGNIVNNVLKVKVPTFETKDFFSVVEEIRKQI